MDFPGIDRDYLSKYENIVPDYQEPHHTDDDEDKYDKISEYAYFDPLRFLLIYASIIESGKIKWNIDTFCKDPLIFEIFMDIFENTTISDTDKEKILFASIRTNKVKIFNYVINKIVLDNNKCLAFAIQSYLSAAGSLLKKGKELSYYVEYF